MGNRLLFYLVIKPISLLPHFLLYRLSDFCFVILYYIVGYRKKVVMQNLTRVYPDMSDSEIKRLRRKFYRHFTDIVMESLKNFSISKEMVAKRMVPVNAEIINDFNAKGRSVIICGGHLNNWEIWAVSSGVHLNPLVMGIYKRLSNAYFDQKMQDSRGKFGMLMVPTTEVKEELKRREGQPVNTVLSLDQSPSNPRKSYWMMFLGQETACSYGPEKMARDYNAPLVYAALIKVKRGYYTVHYELLCEDPSQTEYGDLVRKGNRRLEKDILANPHQWLWTHKRWKHKRPEEMVLDTTL